jgi:hypothetical protein
MATMRRKALGFDRFAERLEERYGIEAIQCGDPDIVDIVGPVEGSILRVWMGEPGESRARYRVKIGISPPAMFNTIDDVEWFVIAACE